MAVLGPDLGGVWLFRIRSIFVLVQARLRYGCSPAAASFSLFLEGSKGAVSTPGGTLANRAFLAVSGPDLGGVWLFRIRSIFVLVQARLRYGCSPAAASFSLSLEGSKGAVSTPGGTLANGTFLAVLGPDLGGVWLFRIRSIFVLVQARLGYGCSPATASFSLSLEGSKGAVSTPGGTLANGAFLAVSGPDLGGVWLFRIRSIFVLVQARLRYGCSPATASFSLSLEGSKGAVSTPGGTLANRAFLAVSLFRIRSIFVLVQARLRYGCSPATASFSLSLEGSKGAVSTPGGTLANGTFLAVLEPDLGRVWLFRIRSIFVLFQARLGYGCSPATASFSLSLEGSKGAVSTSGGTLANGAFLAVLGPDLGGVWLFRIRSIFVLVQARLRYGCSPATASFSLSLEGSKGAVSNPGGTLANGAFLAVSGPDLGGVWLFRIRSIFVLVQARLRYGCSPATASFSLSLEGSTGAVSTPGGTLANGAFLAVLGPDLGGVWLFRIRSIFVLVQARLRYGCSPATASFSLSLEGSTGAVSTPGGTLANGAFLAVSGPDLGVVFGCSGSAPFLSLSRL